MRKAEAWVTFSHYEIYASVKSVLSRDFGLCPITHWHDMLTISKQKLMPNIDNTEIDALSNFI
jgi:hypothetical protein